MDPLIHSSESAQHDGRRGEWISDLGEIAGWVENQVISDLPTDIFFGPTVGVNSPENKYWDFHVCSVWQPQVCPEVSPRLSLHSSLQQGAGHQLHLRGVAAVDGPQGVGSQVGQQQFRAPVQQVEHVLC